MSLSNKLLKNPKLSIVIPTFNSEKYILECLESILVQLTLEVEVIVIDDGSTDNSALFIESRLCSLLESGQAIFKRQSNSGPGAARNIGLSLARGDYLGFVDSDDVVSPNYIAEIFRIIRENEVDIIEFPFRRFFRSKDIISDSFDRTYGLTGFHELEHILEKIFATARWFPCTRVFNRKLVDVLRFPEHVHYEDLMAIPFVYLRASTIYFSELPLYLYRLNPESITSRHTQRQMDEMYEFFMRIDPRKSKLFAILKIRTGRALVYFGSELSSRSSERIAIAVDATRAPLLPAQVRLLSLGDRLFYYWPRLYALFEPLRLLLKKILSVMLKGLKLRSIK